MNTQRIFRILPCLVFLLFFLQTVSAQNQVPFNVISSAGNLQSGGGYILNSTMGEAVTSIILNSSNIHDLGFWYVYRQSTLTKADDEIVPAAYMLGQNYPNPFNPSTVIRYGIPERSMVLIKIYDILGCEILTLVNGEMEAGWYEKEFHPAGFSSGIYIYRMQAGSYIKTKKMTLVK